MFVTDRIYATAVANGEREALVHNGKSSSYRVFHNAVDAARRHLAGFGLRPGSFAVIAIDSIFEAWPVALALRGLGLTTIAVRSASEIANFRDLDIGCVVASAIEPAGELERQALAAGATTIAVGSEVYAGAEAAPLAPPAPIGPAGGHLMLTSGTTGAYKRVLFDAAAEQAHLEAGFDLFATSDGAFVPDGDKTVANLLNFGLWTAAGYNTPLICWSRGGTVIFDQSAAPIASFARRDITHCVITPAFLSALLKAPASLVQRSEIMQLVVVGGALSMALADGAKARLTPHIASALGSTEAGMWALTPLDSAEDLVWHKVHPGRTLEVVDEDDTPVAIGQVGQLRVRLRGGPGGYFNDPQATAEFFRDGWFYPGDLAQFDERGRLALHGRVTDVINVLGDKHAAGPIERALQERLGVDGVCVMSEQAAGRGEIVHVVIETTKPFSHAELAAAAKAELFGFPGAHFHRVEALPRNAMGKVLRLTLRKMLLERQADAA